MKLDPNIKPKPRWWNIIPMLSSLTANAIYPNIYLPKKVYESLLSDNPKLKWIAVLIHEQEHIKREKEIGVIMFGLKYLFSPKFRFSEELIAIKAQMKYLKSVGKKFDTNKAAKYLSGWLYFWPVTYKYAKQLLDGAWKEVK